MSADAAAALLATLAIGLCVGLVLGAALEAWGWRRSAYSPFSHKSGGRWYTVFPQDGPCQCPRCKRDRLILETSHEP